MTTLAYNAQAATYYAVETVANRHCPPALVCEVNDAAKCAPNGFNSVAACDISLNDSNSLKQLIEKHPLFPLLTLIFQKCELATSSNQPSRVSDPVNGPSEQSTETCNMITSHSFDEDIECFAQSLANKSTMPNGRYLGATQLLFSGNEELDSLMVGATRVLRLNLLEIEKVHELADRFVGKYVANIRERILPEIQLDKDDVSESCGSPMASNIDESEAGEKKRSRKRKAAPLPTTYDAPSLTSVANGNATASNEKCSTWLQRVTSPDATLGCSKVEEAAIELPSENKRHQPNHFSVNVNVSINNMNDCSSMLKNSSVSSEASYDDDDNDNDETSSSKRSTKRGVFPKMATNILRAWLFQHLNHPYPTEKQKQQLSHDTNLSVLQVNNWFINARRRIVQPMIDQSNQLNSAVH